MAFSDQFCDLHGFDPDKPYFTAHDQSNCSIIRVHGCASIYSEDEVQLGLAKAAQQLGALLKGQKGRHHSLTITFERSRNTSEEIAEYRAEMEALAGAKRLNGSVIIDEIISVLEDRLIHEEILIACWTGVGAGYEEEVAKERGSARASWGQIKAPNAMDPLITLEALESPHMSFVNSVLDALTTAKISADLLGPTNDGKRGDLAAVRRSVLFHETPKDWTPQTTFERSMPELKDYKTRDLSLLFAPPLAQQLMTSNAKASNDMRSIEFGGRTYATVTASMFPREMALFRLLSSKLERLDGKGDEDMPWRFALHLTGGVKINLLKDIFITLISFLGSANNSRRLANDQINKLQAADHETFVGARMMALTWIEPHESREILSSRRSRLVRALEAWNSPTIVEASTNPMRSLTETAAGMTRTVTSGKMAVAPITELSMSLPFHRTAPIYTKGQSIMISPEGKPIKIAAHSPQQNFWLTLVSAPMGSGKSVWMNRTNVEFAMFTNGNKLPFIGVVDIGPSSSGFIELIKNMAPDDMRHQMLNIQLQNDKAHENCFINPFDLSLGNRKPIARERAYVENFVSEVIADEEGKVNRDLVAALVKKAYEDLSDLDISSSAKRWQEGQNSQLDALCRSLDIPLRETTRWWAIVDALASKGRMREAIMAQRYAAPLLEDLARIISMEEFRKDFGEALSKSVSLRIQGAIEQFPIFSRPTALDIGEARIVSIDLNDVILRGAGGAKRGEARQNSLMYMIASNLFLRQISGNEKEVDAMLFPEEMRRTYREYWIKRFQDIAETPKRFAMDEFHNTGSTPSMVALVEVLAREGRKWGLEIILASQKIDDFDNFTELTSTTILLNATDHESRTNLKRIFGFSEAVSKQIEDHLHGPQPNLGAGFVIGAKLKTDLYWLRVYNHLAPTMLWALDTTKENRLLRNAVVRKVGLERALRLLVARFPRGSAVNFVEQFKSEDITDESIYDDMASQIIRDTVEDKVA